MSCYLTITTRGSGVSGAFSAIPHFGDTFKVQGVRSSNTEQARAQPDSAQRTSLDLLINLLSTNQPVLRELANGYPWVTM
jgi:hypothetical protein